MAFSATRLLTCFMLTSGVLASPSVVRFEQQLPPDDASAGVHWALVVAGSNGWYNYRHQADACHAYQIILKHGIPAERIITMMYDDIAQNEENPTPGIIINHPDGDDVYKGVVIDYKGRHVTPEVFLAVLQGQEEKVNDIGSGRVIKSGPNDHIFVNFVDHGAPGLIAFPNDVLHARDLMSAIRSMHSQNKYQQMVFYIEACESGSMFDNLLPDDIDVYATTAANPSESSYACYYDNKRETYLGDVYSVKWMEDSDEEDLSLETLKKQFKIVRRETNTSHVMEYGDLSIADDKVSDFQGGAKYVAPPPMVLPQALLEAVPSEEVPMAILHHKLNKATTDAEYNTITSQMYHLQQIQQQVLDTMERIVRKCSRDDRQANRVLQRRYHLTNYDCYEPAVDLFDERCFDLSQNDYALRHLHKLVNLCEEQVATETIMAAIAESC